MPLAGFGPIEPDQSPDRKVGAAAAIAYVSAMLALSSVLLFQGAGDGTTSVAGVPIPPMANCLRTRRGANYASVLLPLGNPPREAELLFRPDRVVDAGAVWLLGAANAQSMSLSCNGTSCSDIARVQVGGAERGLTRGTVEFEFASSTADASIAGAWLGMKGEFAIQRGYTYWLTTTHVCWAPTDLSVETPSTSAFPASTVSGSLVTTSPFAGPSECNSSSVHLFPVLAAHEQSFLGLSTNYLYEHAETKLKQRRRDAERGTDCGGLDTAYAMDCAPAGNCQTLPSAPYRRLLSSSLVVLQAAGDHAVLATESTRTLTRVIGLLSAESAFVIGVMRLLLMVLAAVVAYVRGSQEASNPVAMLMKAWKTACRDNTGKRRDNHAQPVSCEGVLLDAFIGLVAIAGRLAVLVAMQDVLLEDGLEAVALAEGIGIAASAAHFSLRHSLDSWAEGVPLTKLGGSMALVDSAAAILLAFTDAPVHGNQISFSGVGRMLAALLISISCIPLAVFATVVCGVTYARARSDDNCSWEYVLFLAVSLLTWLAQLVSIGAALGDCFAGPLAYQMSRNQTGDSSLLRSLVFVAALLLSLPAQNRVVLDTVKAIAEATQKKP